MEDAGAGAGIFLEQDGPTVAPEAEMQGQSDQGRGGQGLWPRKGPGGD